MGHSDTEDSHLVFSTAVIEAASPSTMSYISVLKFIKSSGRQHTPSVAVSIGSVKISEDCGSSQAYPEWSQVSEH